jgi:hypothetical protein
MPSVSIVFFFVHAQAKHLCIGTTALGHDFDAISNDHGSPFLNKYHGVMEAIANPLCVHSDSSAFMQT